MNEWDWGCLFYDPRTPVQGIRWLWSDELREAYRAVMSDMHRPST